MALLRRKLRERFQLELDPVLDGLHRAARRLTRDPAQAEDLLQESILKAYRFFESFRPGTNFRAWIHRVLYTVFVNGTRDRGPRWTPLDGTAEPAAVVQPLLDELERPTHRERAQAVLDAVDDRIREAIMDLPDELRVVFMLSTIEGLKYREIAEVIGCPLGTVMSRLFRSRRWLQDRLQAFAKEEGFDVDAASYAHQDEEDSP